MGRLNVTTQFTHYQPLLGRVVTSPSNEIATFLFNKYGKQYEIFIFACYYAQAHKLDYAYLTIDKLFTESSLYCSFNVFYKKRKFVKIDKVYRDDVDFLDFLISSAFIHEPDTPECLDLTDPSLFEFEDVKYSETELPF